MDWNYLAVIPKGLEEGKVRLKSIYDLMLMSTLQTLGLELTRYWMATNGFSPSWLMVCLSVLFDSDSIATLGS